MAVHIISKKAVHDYIDSHPTSGSALRAWMTLVESQSWERPQDIVATFGEKAVDILGKKDKKPSTTSPERAIVDVKGNHLRIIFKYQFHKKLRQSRIYIKWIGTHVEYDDLCYSKGQFDVDAFK